MICPNCQHENIAAAKFCLECGIKLRAICPHCGAELPPTAKFCHECGTGLTAPMAPPSPPSLETQFLTLQQALPTSVRDHLLTQVEGENRLVTVLFADMSRSVQAMADLAPDEGAALVSKLLKAMVDVLLRYEGRVDRFLGDGLLAVFGAPQARESDPERAILAALAVREAARGLGLEVTAGINTGEVYVGEVGSERHQEVTVMGPAVNLASRLQGQAEPGQILVGEATYRHTRRAFAFVPLSLQLKGIAQPVTAYTVERALPRPEKARGIEGLRAELIGRDEEFAKLRDALAELLCGRGQMVSLIGEAGIGKSRLVAELKQRAVGYQPSAVGGDRPAFTDSRKPKADGPLWLEGRCLELGMGASYWLFVDLFRDYFAFAHEEDERERGARLVANLQALVERGDLSPERLEEMGPLLGNLLSLRFGTDWDGRLMNASPEQIKHQTFMAIRDLLIALSKQQPVILVCEDLHWADSLSLDVISLLMEALTLAPLLLLCVYRPEREHKCWHLGAIAARKCADRYTEIALRELTPLQSRRLVEALLRIENLPASVKELILEKARGNPFFVEEVVRSLIASGMVYQEGEVWRAREGIENVTVPESIQSVILSRVDRLERELRRVLESASVIGRLFRRRLLERTLQGATELERALWELEDQALIYQERAVPEEEYSFKHVLTQETIYASILRRRRTGFHQKVGEAIEALYRDGLEEYYEQLAYHYERSGVDEKAVEYLLKAGEKARRAYLNEEAIGYFQRALERLEKPALGEARNHWRLEALKGLGQTYHGMGREAEAEEQFRQSIALGKEMELAPRELARLYYWLGDVLFWQSRSDEVIRVAEEGLSLLGNDRESLEAVLMESLISAGFQGKGDMSKTQEIADRRGRLLQRLPYCEEVRALYIWVSIGHALTDRNHDRAIETLKELERRAGEHHHLTGLADVPRYLALFNAFGGHLSEAIPHEERALELYTKLGDSKHQSWCLRGLACNSLRLGELEIASEYAIRGLDLVEQIGHNYGIAEARLTMGTVALCRGVWDSAVDEFQKALQICREIGDPFAAQVAHSLGCAYLAQGQREAALRQFEEAISFIPPGSHQRISLVAGALVAGALSDLEVAYDDPHEFLAFCHRWREEHPEVRDLPFVQWYLEPAEPDSVLRIPYFVSGKGGPVFDFAEYAIRDTQYAPLDSGWVWQDPFGDCSFRVRNGLEVHAANGRDLQEFNLSAPRLLRPVSGNFAAQTICIPASTGKPAIGGLLLWKDRANYVRLDRGTRGKDEISFQGCLGHQDAIFGRGRLVAERVLLRLERLGGQVRALCSADGEEWVTAGHVEFPADDSVEVGLHAIGNIDRTVYPGAYPEGTAIRFESFELCR